MSDLQHRASRPGAADQPPPDPADAALAGLVKGPPIHAHDRVPGWVLDLQAWLYARLPADTRVLISLVAVFAAIALLALLISVRFLALVIDALDVFAFVGLFLVNWLGNGGALVPIPGARLIGLLMIFSHAVLLPSWEVFAVSGAAMGLGLLSYYVVGARADAAYERGDLAGATRLATDAGVLPGGADADTGRATTAADGDAADTSPAHRDLSAHASRGQQARRSGLRDRFTTGLQRTGLRARPIIERHGTWGMFWLCLPPVALGTAGAFLGGALGFGFKRFLASAFAAKYLLAGIVVVAGLVFSEQARAVQLPF